jgi:alpha-ribazole phosphatase
MSLMLMRHPAIDSATGRCIGQTDVDLSAAGNLSLKRLAREACRLLPDQIISSDLKRCRVLTEEIASRLRMTPVFDPVWREIDFGLWENRTWEAIRCEETETFADWVANYVRVAPPGGESFSQLQKRILPAIGAILARQAKPGRFASVSPRVLVVTHAGVIRATYAAFENLPLSRVFDYQIPYGGMLPLNWRTIGSGVERTGSVPKKNAL